MIYRKKVVICGDSRVGKSALLTRYIKDSYHREYNQTVGANVLIKKLDANLIRDTADIGDLDYKNSNDHFIIYFWDIMGSSNQLSLNENYLTKSAGAIVVFDVTSRQSFNRVEFWIKRINELNENIPLVIVGNKTDKTHKRLITYEGAREKAKEYSAKYVETSAKTGHNISRAFKTLMSNIINLPKVEISEFFKINDLVDLRLIEDRTYIYVNDEEFLICARLLLNIPVERISEADEIRSIDEAAEVFQRTLWQNRILEGPISRDSRHFIITPEEEFQGHCSNIQAFFESGLQTDILASNIAFPLLKKLVDLDYSPAVSVFKEEIAKRFEEGVKSSKLFLLKGGYLRYLNEEERQSLKGYDELSGEIIEEILLNQEVEKRIEETKIQQKQISLEKERKWLSNMFGKKHGFYEILRERVEKEKEIEMLNQAVEILRSSRIKTDDKVKSLIDALDQPPLHYRILRWIRGKSISKNSNKRKFGIF